jgi:hypothetical protein
VIRAGKELSIMAGTTPQGTQPITNAANADYYSDPNESVAVEPQILPQ